MLPFALHGYRTSAQTSTGATPYSLVYGVAPQNLPSWFWLMFHHENHIALHSYIVMGLKYFGYQVFLKLWRLIALTSCSSRILLSKPLDLSSSKSYCISQDILSIFLDHQRIELGSFLTKFLKRHHCGYCLSTFSLIKWGSSGDYGLYLVSFSLGFHFIWIRTWGMISKNHVELGFFF